jgi:VIT1/CCC1 family predicted Fe2+/Mn2+ transporter
MMHEELNLFSPRDESPTKNAVVTFISFMGAGLIPLIPYIVFIRTDSFSVSILFTAVALFVVGALRRFFSTKSWFVLGMEMLSVGGIAALIAYGVGFFLKSIV